MGVCNIPSTPYHPREARVELLNQCVFVGNLLDGISLDAYFNVWCHSLDSGNSAQTYIYIYRSVGQTPSSLSDLISRMDKYDSVGRPTPTKV